MWAVVLVAGIIVLSSGGAMFLGGLNEPGLPANTRIDLTYTVKGSVDGLSIDGEFTLEMWIIDGYSHIFSYLNGTGGLGGFGFLPDSVLLGGYFLNRTTIDTPWGAKCVDRVISYVWMSPDRSTDICIVYRGAHTGLAYLAERFGPGLRVEYALSSIDFTGLEDMDRRPVPLGVNVMRPDRLDGDFHIQSNCGYWSLLGSEKDRSFEAHMEGRGFTLLAFDDRDIWGMIKGGEFQASVQWTQVGEGSVDFTMPGGPMFFLVLQNEPSYLWHLWGTELNG